MQKMKHQSNKLYLALAVLFIANAVTALPTLQEEDDIANFKYPRYINFPDGEGHSHLIDLEEEIDEDLLDIITEGRDVNSYHLFTSNNPRTSQELIINDLESVKSSFFDPSLPIVVVVHGWISSASTDINPAIRDAYLRHFDMNVIVVDWKRLAFSGYVTAASGVPGVGKNLGKFLQFLNSFGADYSTMHLVGFSLGAHVVGNAGRALNSRVGRITGLDPAGPLWLTSNNRLQSDDAIYVEAVHTDGGFTIGGLGIGRDIAQVDFYPNGGLSQPGCLTNICNHNRAWEFFAVSVAYNNLIGNKCESNTQLSFNLCRGVQFPLGNGFVFKNGSGRFRVNTGRRYPFGNVNF